MKNKALWAYLLPVLALLVLLALWIIPGTSMAGEQDAKTLFTDTHKCNMCHAVGAVGIEAKTKSDKMKGEDLSGFETKKTFAEIAAYVRKEGELDGKTHKKPFKGTDEELQAIIDWLGSLEAQE